MLTPIVKPITYFPHWLHEELTGVNGCSSDVVEGKRCVDVIDVV